MTNKTMEWCNKVAYVSIVDLDVKVIVYIATASQDFEKTFDTREEAKRYTLYTLNRELTKSDDKIDFLKKSPHSESLIEALHYRVLELSKIIKEIEETFE